MHEIRPLGFSLRPDLATRRGWVGLAVLQPDKTPKNEGRAFMRHLSILAVAVGLAASAAAAGAYDQREMDGQALRKALTGRTIHLTTPLGRLPISFRADGTMWGRAGSLASYVGSERDRGRWWIAANQLCQRWNVWLGGRSYCFRLRQRGGTVLWTRNDGLRGVATITR